MDFSKIQRLVDPGIVIDIEGANIHDLRATNNIGNKHSWRHFTPEEWENEERVVVEINRAFQSNPVLDKEVEAGYK